MPFGIVTGAAGELGRAMSLRLARAGWRLVLADLDAAALERTRERIVAGGGIAESHPMDVSREEDWTALRDKLKAREPQLDLLVNVAGICASGEVDQMPLAEWDRIFGVNFRGTLLGCHTMIPWLKENPQRSHLVNFVSITAIAPFPRLAAYNASKAAVLSLSESLYNELRPSRVRVTAVCPAVVKSNLVVGMRHYDPDGKYDAVVKEMAATSWITPEKVADKAYRGMLRGKPLVFVGVRAVGLSRMRQLLGGLFLDFYRRFWWPKSLR